MAVKTYEGLFLLDPAKATQDWEGIKKQIIDLLERREGQLINFKKWAERKLAYEIKGHKRGTYLLMYFQMPAQNVAVLKRDIQLSELVLRTMILQYRKSVNKDSVEDFSGPEPAPIDENPSRQHSNTEDGE